MASPLVTSIRQSARRAQSLIPFATSSTTNFFNGTPSSSRSTSSSAPAQAAPDHSAPHVPTSVQHITPNIHASTSEQETHVIESKPEALSLLRAQPIHYVVCSIAGRTLLLHQRDLFSLHRLNDVSVGDVLELDRIHEVGSRDYTLRAQDPISTRSKGAVALMRRSVPIESRASTILSNPAVREAINLDEPLKESQSWAARLRPAGLAHVGATLGPETVRVRCTVVEHTKGPMEVIVKRKRRKGYKRTIRHKQTYTRLRVEAIQIGEGESHSI